MHTLNKAVLPRYLRSDQDIAVWHALEAAIGQVRDDVMQGNVDPDDTQLLDERIRTEFIPHALAEQEHTLPPGTQLPPYAAQVVFSLLRGFAELDPLLLDPEVSEVIVDGPDQEVYVERHGLLEGTGLVLSRDRILYLAERMGSAHGQLLSEARPVQEIRLPNARVTAVHDRLILGGPSLVIRLHGRRRLRSADLIALGTISQPLLDALCLAFRGGANVLIAGEVSSGKTTLLQILLESLPPDRRIVTVEDPAEIELPRPRLKQLEVRQPNNEGTGGYTQRDLVRLSLRLRPDHLIVGEVRDGAGWDMVDAMSLGHNGSVATIHAGSPLLALMRLESLCLRAEDVPSLAAVRRAIGEAVNVVVQMQRLPGSRDGSPVIQRVVTEIAELTGMAHPGESGPFYHLTPLAEMQGGSLQLTGKPLSAKLAARLHSAGIAPPFSAPAA